VSLYDRPSAGVWVDTFPGDELCVSAVEVLPATGHPEPIDRATYICGHGLPCPVHA
jgi:hypothetical protein